MPVSVNGVVYYRAVEACTNAGISRNTFIRWIRDGKFEDVALRDRNGWRLFTEDDIRRLRTKVNHVQEFSTIQNEDYLHRNVQ
ncbi:MAG TPA: hypothetical protein VGA85_01680 [Dehalococcoidales bacterium]|jgi:predicted site-specific integrase-resolvase